MGLFYDLLNSINDPSQKGNVEELTKAMQGIQTAVAGQGLNPNQTQNLISSLGSQLRPLLANQAQSANLPQLLGQLAGGGGGGLSALSGLMSGLGQSQSLNALAQAAGIGGPAVQNLLPSLLPSVLGLLSMGNSQSGLTGNPILKSFLDADKDGDADLGDVFFYARRFLRMN
jgi:hypothetical protein